MDFKHKNEFNNLTKHLSVILKEDPFKLLDVGCHSGIDQMWREFGENLSAVGIDPVVDECKRLQAQELNPNVKYISAFIENKNLKLYNRSHGDPGNRLASHYYSQLFTQKNIVPKDEQLGVLNNWQDWDLSVKNLTIDEIVNENLSNLDFIKIDVDGDDFKILESAIDTINNSPVIGIAIEVNFYGRGDDNSNTMHNVDKHLRKLGFDIFDISPRRYNSSKLPGTFQWNAFAQSKSGRIYQADALYLRDPVSAIQGNNPIECPTLTPLKIIKLACLFELFGLPDYAAELLIYYTQQLENIINIDECLNILTKEFTGKDISYKNYMDSVISDPTMLFPNKS